MKRKRAKIIFNVLIALAAALLLWQSLLPDEAGWGWQGVGAIVLCLFALAVNMKWNRCPHCGRLVPRDAGKKCTYCGKTYEEE